MLGGRLFKGLLAGRLREKQRRGPSSEEAATDGAAGTSWGAWWSSFRGETPSRGARVGVEEAEEAAEEDELNKELVDRLGLLDGTLERTACFADVLDSVKAMRSTRRHRATAVVAALRGASSEEQCLSTVELEAVLATYALQHESSSLKAAASVTDVGLAVDVALAVDGARTVVESVLERLAGEVAYKRGYWELLVFVVSTLLLLLVVVAQRGFGEERTATYQAVTSAMFGDSNNAVGGSISVSSKLVSAEAFLNYAEEYILDPIFETEHCGDDVCQSPDEQAEYSASSSVGARVFPESCAADCGVAATRRVRIEFFDVGKLWQANKQMTSLLKEGWRGLSAERWGVSSLTHAPVAGWNVCARDISQFGHFESLCVLDGDATIKGRPYRTAELDPSTDSFGGAVELELFEADSWEVRVAYANFEWESLTENADLGGPPKAFPAVRGRICKEVAQEDASTFTTTSGTMIVTVWGECEIWSPCPDAESCPCLFYGSEHVCFREGAFQTWSQTFYDFAKENSVFWLAQWWGLEEDVEEAETTYADVQNAGGLDDDQWHVFNSATRLFRLELDDASFPFDGWSTACLTVVDDGGIVVSGECEQAQGANTRTVDLYLEEGANYEISVGPDCDSTQVEWRLIDESSGLAVRSGGDCALCTIDLASTLVPAACPRDCTLADYPSLVQTPTECLRLLDGRRRLLDDGTPTAAPTSVENVFGVDLRELSAKNEFFASTQGCLFASLANGECDAVNNNAVCAFDGGDCCVDTCSTFAGDSDEYYHCPFNPNDGSRTDDGGLCFAPPRAGSVKIEDGSTCDLGYSLPPEDQTGVTDDPAHLTYAIECEPSWPYKVEDGSEPGWHFTLPFVAYSAYREVLRVRNGEAWALPAHSEVPSLYCPDCSLAHLSGLYGSFPFSLNVSAFFREAAAEAGQSIKPLFAEFPVTADSEPPRRVRYFVKPNLVLVGPKLTTERYKTEECHSGEGLFTDGGDDRCLNDKELPLYVNIFATESRRDKFKSNRYDASAYGIDATFSSSSSNGFRATNRAADFYEHPTELNERGLPYGFFDDMGSPDEAVEGFPCVFDVRVNTTRYEALFAYLRDGGYVDDSTRRVTLTMSLFNQETGQVSSVELSASRVDEGGFDFKWAVTILDALHYESAGDFARLFFELAWLLVFAFRLVSECREFRQQSSCRSYLGDWRNRVDLGAYAAMATLVVKWVQHVLKCDKLGLRRYAEVYADFTAVGRPFKSGAGMKDLIQMEAELGEVATSAADYQMTVSICIFFAVLQSLKNLDFHPKLGLTTSTIFIAGQDLAFFGALFTFILLLFAVLGTLLFGTEIEQFQSTPRSCVALLDILFGEFGSLADEKNSGDHPASIIFFYSFIGISSLILLNALLAIIVDAYAVVKELSSKSLTPEIIVVLLKRSIFGVYHPRKALYIPAETMDQKLKDRLSPRSRKEDKEPTATQRRRLSVPRLATANPAASRKASANALFLNVSDYIIIAVDEGMLAAALQFIGTSQLDEDALLLVYNVMEQHGHARDVAHRPEAEREALRLLNELKTISRFFPADFDAQTRLLLVLHFVGRTKSSSSSSQEEEAVCQPKQEQQPKLEALEAKLGLLHSKMDTLATAVERVIVSHNESKSTSTRKLKKRRSDDDLLDDDDRNEL